MREDWEYKKLEDISSSVLIEKAKKRFSPNDVIRYIDISSIDNINQCLTGTISFKMLDAPSRAQQKVEYGDILISTVRPNLRNIAIVNDDATNLVASSGFCVLRINDAALRRYIFYYVVSNKFTAYLEKLTNGANYPAVKETDVRKALIPIPPKPTQLSIVTELDKLNELIQIKKEQLRDYDTLAQSIFYEMFGDPVVNEKGWEVISLSELSMYPNERIAINQLSPSQYVGVENLIKDRGGVRFSNSLPKANSAIAYKENDILLGNIRPYLKKIWLADKGGGASGDVVIIRISNRKITPVFLFKVLSSDSFFEYDNTYTKGAKMPRGDRKVIAKFGVILPPLPLQQSFAHKIEQIERQKASVQKTISDLEMLLASRMQYWFD
ncbi:restriction endonuclease subunit S [Prevotella jejuni]|uniref:restriction endonuclease subunit S n=1 Tax=Prevotella jejuni TaxID=1177574 RepID=UPI00352E1CE3